MNDLPPWPKMPEGDDLLPYVKYRDNLIKALRVRNARLVDQLQSAAADLHFVGQEDRAKEYSAAAEACKEPT